MEVKPIATTAQDEYSAAVADLKEFCKKETNFNVRIITDDYPLQIHFIPAIQQTSLFETDNYDTDSDGEICGIVIKAGISTTIQSNLRFGIEASLLKKLISLSTKIGELYMNAFRERAQYEIPELVKSAMDGIIENLWLTNCPGEVYCALFDKSKFDEQLESAINKFWSIN